MNGGLCLLADAAMRTRFEFGRDLSEPIDWLLPLGVAVLLAWFVVGVLVRDCVELGKKFAAVLITLRLLALLGILAVYLQPQWRTQRDVVENSRVLLLVDTSQSMGRRDVPVDSSLAGTGSLESRIGHVVRELSDGVLLDALRATHDVVVYRFGQEDRPTPVASLGKQEDSTPGMPSDDAGRVAEADSEPDANAPIAWNDRLPAQGGDTKIGQVLYQLVADERSTPVSAVIVLSDGQRTAGLAVDEAAEFARKEGIPVYTIGLGSIAPPQFVRLADFAAPARTYCRDPFEVTTFVQSEGLAGRSAVVTLKQVAGAEGAQPKAADTGMIYDAEVTLGANLDDVVPVKFQIDPIETPGRYAYELAVAVKGGGTADEGEQRHRFYVDVVDRKTRILLLAGGPSREYRFLRGLLRRDEHIDLQVLLQSKRFEKVKDRDYLVGFPSSEEALAEYDGIVAIDPDWDAIGAQGVAMIEAWVGDSAGGLIVVPGYVNAGDVLQSWIHNDDFKKLRDLFPVVFSDDVEGLEGKSTKQAWPVALSRAGMDAEFLRLDENPSESQRIWAQFEGIYGGYPVREKKYGATVYAKFLDPMAESSGYEPIYFAGQFYGKGRVFYIGSGELWRLRQVGEGYFEQFYTRLIRHVTTGRLNRGSTRGDMLLLEKENYHVGDTVPVIAHLKNAQRQPLSHASVPLFVFDPSDKVTTVALKADPVRPGTYRGEFIARVAQDYRLELKLPESDDEPLSKVIKVTTSDRERKNPQQADQVLKALADTTGARYFGSLSAAMGRGDDPPLVPSLVDQARMTPIVGEIDPLFGAAWSRWMMFGICGLLCVEWLLRRLFKLA